MRPGEIRARIQADHAALRVLLEEVAELARRVEAGRGEAVAPLRERGLALHDRLAAHLDVEDRILLPWLRTAGEEPAERLATEHTEQRLLLEYILGRLRDAKRPSLVLGRELRGFVELLLDDMADEERRVLAAGPSSPA
jgi:hemerythrin-like domain-containing protein